MGSKVLNVRMSEELHADFMAFCENVHIPASTLMAAFAAQTVRLGRVPFDIQGADPAEPASSAMVAASAAPAVPLVSAPPASPAISVASVSAAMPISPVASTSPAASTSPVASASPATSTSPAVPSHAAPAATAPKRASAVIEDAPEKRGKHSAI